MTNREFYQSVVDLINAQPVTSLTPEQDALLAKAQELIAKLDATNAKRSSAESRLWPRAVRLS